MKALGRIWRGESKCAYCGDAASGWSNGNATCRRHRTMDHAVGGGGRGRRGHNAMTTKAHRQLNRKLEPRTPRQGESDDR